MYAVVTALAAAAFAGPTLAAAAPAEEGAVIESLAPARQWPWGYWTRERLEEAEPLPIITLPGPEAPAAPEPLSAAQPEAASTAALTAAVAGPTGAFEGVEVEAAGSTPLPANANGKVFGSFYIRVGAGEFKREDYVCSGAVVDSPRGNVIVTAGHCALDPESGTPTSKELIFIPGYRDGETPYGVWKVGETYSTTETWKNTAKAGSRPNEGGDLAFIELQDNDHGESVEEAVGAMGVAFDQTCNQVYTQFGYPAESPYDGQVLYSHVAPYLGSDTASLFSPVPMKIASDFTRGASGGPWAIGVTSSPTILSLTAYGYENQPGYLYGPYFGEAARKAYEIAIGRKVPPGIEESCAALPPAPPAPPQPTLRAATPSPTPTPTPAPEATPAETPVTLKLTRVRRRANGSAVLTAKVSSAGKLKLSGAAVRAEAVNAPAAGKYRLVIAPKRPTNRRLRRKGRAKVGVKVAFSASGRTKRVSRKIRLSRRSASRSVRWQASRSHSSATRRPRR